MSKPVRIAPAAEQHILQIDEWWRANRDKAPDLFARELAIALRTISLMPSAGGLLRSRRRSECQACHCLGR